MLSFHQAVADDFTAVNELIIKQVNSHVELVEDIGHYLIQAGGKRLRPLLVLLVANSLHYKGKHHHDLAAIIEFIHSATLLHDDVVDVSDMRRGRPTANAKWGNAPSVLVGDFLYSRAFQMMVALNSMEIMGILSNTTNTISEGEVQQLINAGDPKVDEQNYLQVIYKKTAALFEGACETAAVLSELEADKQEKLKQYGYDLGMAFQLVDDCLDYTGSAEALGKNVGDDLAEGKPTLPLIYAMEHGKPEEAKIIAGAIENSGQTPLDSDTLAQIIQIVQSTGAIDYTQAQALAFAESAKAAISFLDDSIYKTALMDLADFSVGRDH